VTSKPKNVFVVGRSDDDPAAENLRVGLRGLGYVAISDWTNKPQPRSRLGSNAIVHTQRAVEDADVIVIIENDDAQLESIASMIANSARAWQNRQILVVGEEARLPAKFQHLLPATTYLPDTSAVVLHLTQSAEGATVH